MKHLFAYVAVVLLGSLVARPAWGQADFQPGYVVRPAGDTVRGLVDYRIARLGNAHCQFRAAADAPTQVFQPTQLRAYGVRGEIDYRSRLQPQPDSAGQPRPARPEFLEVLVDGPPAALYQWHAGSADTRYYVQKDSVAPLRELRVERRVVMQGAIKYTQDVPLFRGVLSEQFADCPGVLLSLAKTELTPTSLAAAVRRYNACRLPGTAQAAVRRVHEVGLEVLLGGQTSRLTTHDFYKTVALHSGLRPEVGLGFSVSSRSVRNKLFLRLEVLYDQQHYNDEFKAIPTTGGAAGSGLFYPYTYQVDYQTTYLRIPLLLRYSPLPGRVQPFIEAGITASPLLSFTQRVRYHDNTTTTFGPWQQAYYSENVRHLEEGVLAGVGVRLLGLGGHPASLLGRVEASNGFLNTLENYNTALRYHVLLAFSLTRQHR